MRHEIFRQSIYHACVSVEGLHVAASWRSHPQHITENKRMKIASAPLPPSRKNNDRSQNISFTQERADISLSTVLGEKAACL